MKKFLLVMVFISLFFIVGKADALVFEYNDQVHVITERENPCGQVDEMELSWFGENGDLYFDVDGEQKKITKENKCLELTIEDEFLEFQSKRYRYELELDDNENLVINKYDKRYEEAYFQTQDIVLDGDKIYYQVDEENVEMNIVSNPVVEDLNKYYESGYVTMLKNNEQESEVVYYERLGSYIIDNNLIFNKVSNFDKEKILNYYIVNNNVLKPEYVVDVNKEAFEKIFEEIKVSYYDIVNIGDYFMISIEDDNNNQYIYDTEGNLLVKNGGIYPIFDGLYMIFDSENGSRIYDAEENLIKKVEDYVVILETYFSDYKGIMIGMKDFDQLEKTELLEHRIYEIKDGKNQKYDGKDLSLTVSGDYSLFDRVLINGKELDSKYYTKESGSTIITLKDSYLKTLNKGSYKLTVEYTDGGYVETTFEVDTVGIANPNTYDGIGTTILIVLLSLVGLIGTVIFFKKTNKISL